MTCTDCQNQIFDGELDRIAVEHLAQCDDCCALDREVRLNTATLADLREEVIAVRTPRRRWPWVAAVAAAAVVAVAIWPSRPIPVPNPPVAVLQPLPAEPVTPSIPVVAKLAPVRRARPVRPKPAPLAAETAEPLTVKFFTDDPNVVIYWQIDPPKGEVGL